MCHRQAEVCRYAPNECSSDSRQELGRLQQHYDLYFVRPRPRLWPPSLPQLQRVISPSFCSNLSNTSKSYLNLCLRSRLTFGDLYKYYAYLTRLCSM